MTVLSVKNMTLRFGVTTVLQGITFALEETDRLGNPEYAVSGPLQIEIRNALRISGVSRLVSRSSGKREIQKFRPKRQSPVKPITTCISHSGGFLPIAIPIR